MIKYKNQGEKMEKEMLQYKIKYSKIKNVYIQIKEGEVIVKAPTKTTKLVLNYVDIA